MATVLTSPTNGVSFGFQHTVTAQDASDGSVLIDFQSSASLAAVVQVLDASGNDVTADAIITFPAAGQVQVASGSTYTVTQDQVVNVIANRASAAE